MENRIIIEIDEKRHVLVDNTKPNPCEECSLKKLCNKPYVEHGLCYQLSGENTIFEEESTDGTKAESYLISVNKLYKKYKGYGIHQLSIDSICDVIDGLEAFSEVVNPTDDDFSNFLSSFHYGIVNAIEICDKNLEDYKMLTELEKILNK